MRINSFNYRLEITSKDTSTWNKRGKCLQPPAREVTEPACQVTETACQVTETACQMTEG